MIDLTRTRARTIAVLGFAAVAAVLAFSGAAPDSGLAKPGGKSGASCGGFRMGGPRACAAGYFCDYKPADICGAADAPGICRRKPLFCTKIFAPVCGCGDQTFANDCLRRAAGIGKLRDGECKGA